MDNILFTAVDGASNDLVRQDVIANNLANINTPGFKENLYQAQVMYQTDSSGVINNNTQTYVVELPSSIDMTPAALMTTGRPLDIAVSGSGFIAVQASDGSEVYTRGGSLHTDSQGQLLTDSGNLVLGDGGPIAIPPGREVRIGTDGTVSIIPIDGYYKSPVVVDRIRTVSLDLPHVTRSNDGFLRLSKGGAATEDATIQVVSGALEGSNVNSVDQLVQMITANRDFDAQMKIIATVELDADKLAQVLQE
jgi:flagellar basal-body rod protein FlgF